MSSTRSSRLIMTADQCLTFESLTFAKMLTVQSSAAGCRTPGPPVISGAWRIRHAPQMPCLELQNCQKTLRLRCLQGIEGIIAVFCRKSDASWLLGGPSTRHTDMSDGLCRAQTFISRYKRLYFSSFVKPVAQLAVLRLLSSLS